MDAHGVVVVGKGVLLVHTSTSIGGASWGPASFDDSCPQSLAGDHNARDNTCTYIPLMCDSLIPGVAPTNAHRYTP